MGIHISIEDDLDEIWFRLGSGLGVLSVLLASVKLKVFYVVE